MLTTRRVIAAKIEVTEGTGETLTDSEGGILVIDPKVDVDIKMNPRNPVMATLSKFADIAGSQLARITFRAELKGVGSAYAAANLPALSPYLRACGFAETLDVTVDAETVTYQPASTGVPTITIGAYEDGVIKRIIGARGNVKFAGVAGEVVYADFDFLGVWDGATDGALLAPTYESTIPPTFLSANFSVAAYAAIINSFNVDMANELKLREDANKSTGYISTVITGRDPNGTFDPEMVTVAAYDWYGKWKAGTTGALNVGSVGATQYNKFKITAPKLLPRKVSDSDREGIVVAENAFQLAMDSGDDEIVILFD